MFNHTSYHLYEGCGNRFLIAHLEGSFSRNDSRLRREFQRVGLKQEVDSVLVLIGDPEYADRQGYHVTMDVFEPRGIDAKHPKLPGSWSTMCGNGIRAVTRYLLDTTQLVCCVKTRSGIRKTAILSDNLFRINMGKFTRRRADLEKYVRKFDFARIVDSKVNYKDMFVGLNGTPNVNGRIDGEPHVVVVLGQDAEISMHRLKKITERIGSKITANREYFPECINTNVVVLVESTRQTVSVKACTFERGVEYVTQSCGTGATVIGSHFLLRDRKLRAVNVRMPGGTLYVTRAPLGEFYLTGPANPIPSSKPHIDADT